MDIFNILRDRDRLKIVLLLINEEICVCDLEDTLGLKQSTLSNKLKVLKEAGIINVRKEKNWHYYSLNTEFYQDNLKLFEYIQEKNSEISISKSCCEVNDGK